MPRKTTEQLQQELEELEERVVAIKAILNNRKNQKLQKGILFKKCPICSSSFETMEQRKIYCSKKCRHKASNQNRSKKNIINKLEKNYKS
tara:strand:+ start:317 stop:586 length:270 start_codon:yes stop_codon:yes gene_type:complete